MGQGGAKVLEECRDGMWYVSNDELDGSLSNAVFLNVYDLNEDWEDTNHIFQEKLAIGGAFHAGVEVFGREWSFNRDGIYHSTPRCNDVHVYRTSIFIGYTKYSCDAITCILEDELYRSWPGKSYDLLGRNCCSFARAFCKRITRQCIPDWVDRLPRLANSLTKPALNVVDLAAGVAMSYAPGRDMSLDEYDEFSIASSVFSTPAPTPKAEFYEDPLVLRSISRDTRFTVASL